MRRIRRTALIVVLGVALVAAGCGDDDDDDSTSAGDPAQASMHLQPPGREDGRGRSDGSALRVLPASGHPPRGAARQRASPERGSTPI